MPCHANNHIYCGPSGPTATTYDKVSITYLPVGKGHPQPELAIAERHKHGSQNSLQCFRLKGSHFGLQTPLTSIIMTVGLG